MKLRFFVTILLVVLMTVVSVSFVLTYFFNNERDRLINQQIESHASLLLSSNLSSAQLEDFEEAENIITEVLGGTRINQIIVIYNRAGQAIYRNKNATLLQIDAPFLETWSTLKLGEHTLRILTVPFPKRKRVLQFGFVFNQSVDQWDVISQRAWLYIAAILVLTVLISFLLTTLLVRPLKGLAEYLRHLTTRFETDFAENHASPLPVQSSESFHRKDEFSQLSVAIHELLDKIRFAFKANQTRSAQLAHELKTPLTIIRNLLEDVRKSSDPVVQGRVQEAVNETEHLNAIITGFLEWSVAENTPGHPEKIHAIHLEAYLRQLIKSLQRIYADRIDFDVIRDTIVFCKPEHLDQVLSNLIVNALKYSPQSEKVKITLNGDVLDVRDRGRGIPAKVLSRLGMPFNFGGLDSGLLEKGSGLGLAWVHTICQKYRWVLEIKSQSTGTHMRILFQTEEDLTVES